MQSPIPKKEIVDIEKIIERNKPKTNEAIEKMRLTGQHPLSVYFQNDEEEPEH
jgi:hypothetical protein